MKIRRFVLKAEKVIDRLLGVYNNRLPATTYTPLKELGEKYGLEIVTDARSDDEDIEFDCPSAAQVRIYAPLLASELAVYPPDFIKQSNVERLVLCTNLRSLHHKVSGVADLGLFKIDTLFLDRSHAAKNWDFSRRAFHHELFHAIDFSDSMEGYVDTEWRKLNSEDYKYFANDENFVATEINTAGFLTAYSTRSALEDKAELYSFLVMNHAAVQTRCLTDEILSNKVEHLKQLLRRFSEHCDDGFWDKMQNRTDQIAQIKGRIAKLQTDPPRMIDAVAEKKDALGTQKIDPLKAQQMRAKNKVRGTVVIEAKVEDGRKIWVSTIKRDDGDVQTSTYYTFNKLKNDLKKLGITDISKDEFTSKNQKFTL